MTRPFLALATLGLMTIAACRAKEPDTSGASSTAAADSATKTAGSLEGPTRTDSAGGMAGMQGTQGMPGMQGMTGGMMDSMQTHMRMMDSMSADRMKGMLPAHRQMVANMLAQMNQEMRGMNMPADAAWTATVDSIRQDLVRMPEMSAAELKAAMPGHHARVTRLGQMHQAMMQRMPGAKP